VKGLVVARVSSTSFINSLDELPRSLMVGRVSPATDSLFSCLRPAGQTSSWRLVKGVRAALILGIQLPHYTVPLFRFLIFFLRGERCYHAAVRFRCILSMTCAPILPERVKCSTNEALFAITKARNETTSRRTLGPRDFFVSTHQSILSMLLTIIIPRSRESVFVRKFHLAPPDNRNSNF